MKSTRSGANQKEESGHIIGGYASLLKAMADQIQARGGRIHLQTPVREIIIQDGQARGIQVGDQFMPFDVVAATVQTPIFKRLIPAADPAYLQFLDDIQYMGIICPLVVLDRPLSGYWTLNITDESIPFTGVIETTSYIDPQYVGGHHLVYLPKYTAPGSSWQQKPDPEIREIWTQYLKTMFPDFDPASIRHFLIHRERFVEPIHRLNGSGEIPALQTPVKDLFLATTAQIYPALTNGESVTRYAQESSRTILAHVGQSEAAVEMAAE
jgi:protoporphyrinogen oxidase